MRDMNLISVRDQQLGNTIAEAGVEMAHIEKHNWPVFFIHRSFEERRIAIIVPKTSRLCTRITAAHCCGRFRVLTSLCPGICLGIDADGCNRNETDAKEQTENHSHT